MIRSEQLDELATALSAAQAEFGAVPKDSDNPFFKSKYASLAQSVKSASPIVTKHGLSVAQFLGYDEAGDTLTTWLLHKSGQFIAESAKLHLPKQDAQGQGSATTYARRYAYMAALGLVADEDDDGNKAASASKQRTGAPQRGPQRASASFKPVYASAPSKPEPLATDDDVAQLATSVKGLTGRQIRLAFSSCNLPTPEKVESLDDLMMALGRVPRSKTGELARTLAGVKR